MAQGIVGSTAAASQEFLADGAWNKRLHPGRAGVAGITAAYLARGGFVSTRKTYEGRFGLFKSHLHADESKVQYRRIVAGLGETWELTKTSLTPYPICHFLHACAESAVELARRHRLKADDIDVIRVLLPKEGLPVVAEPEAAKMAPVTAYEAQFSAPFVVAASLVIGRFGLAELSDDVLSDARVLALSRKVKCSADPDSGFPTYYSGGVIVTTTAGEELRHYVRVNCGAGERALTASDIESKFMSNAEMLTSPQQARALLDCILTIESHSAPAIARSLSAAGVERAPT
jgi:2-methylcitrate dehydratase PrpD